MKKTNSHKARELNESEREERYAAQLKAKKQRLSKSSKKKDTD